MFIARLYGVLVVLCIVHGFAVAQYYEEREYLPSQSRYITMGFFNRDFAPRDSNPLSDSLAIRYTRIMPLISFRQGAAEFLIGYTRYRLSGSTKSAVFFGGRFGSEVPIAGRRSSMLLFPLQLAVDYTKCESAGTSKDDFNIASVGVGGGLKYRHFSEGIDFSVGIEELAQYSTDGFGVGNGFSASTLGDAVLLLSDVGILDGVVIGYRFRLQTWSLNENKFNYRAVSHGPYLGIVF